LAEYGRVASVDAQFFRAFAVEPMIGRTFTANEVGPGAPSHVVVSHSFDVKPIDAAVYLAVVMLLSLGTLTASCLPARRATVVNPMDVLKVE
jgi:hypothetical protein